MKRKSMILYLLLLFSCREKHHYVQLTGKWKILHIELQKDKEWQREILTLNQYWNFRKNKQIDIYNEEQWQKTLFVQVKNQTIGVLDTINGRVKDEFEIRQLDRNNLVLYCPFKDKDKHYGVLYSLEKVKDEN